MQNKAQELLPTRTSLLGRLKNWQDEETWQEFYNLYRRLIFATAVKAGLTESEAEDVVQETVLSVAKTIDHFEYDRTRCTFKGWLRHLAEKRIADQFRKRSRNPTAHPAGNCAGEETPVLERLPAAESLALEAIWEEEWRQNLFNAALERVKAQANPEQYQIFDFYVLRKMAVKKVAAALEISSGKVYLDAHRISRLIKKEVQALEKRLG